ncbi:hypothetical protein [Chryseobacterium potabilaquae]|uniref:Uncharacterized protein n=1 Tax=Chryseobacterium potabilaquae TaxID=2675057 RepID=A0A6N4X8P8_9FLAO|nr:hypothetical protein [Chryseobacterium potabilaquae]CAA7197476.1 hypothetical protein CHRY9293_03535 [Chryseobacterium potabilaquae]
MKSLDDNNLKQNLLKLKAMLEEYKEPSSYMDNNDDNIIINDSQLEKYFFAKSLPLAVIKTSE